MFLIGLNGNRPRNVEVRITTFEAGSLFRIGGEST
jgi:hypothetical protein